MMKVSLLLLACAAVALTGVAARVHHHRHAAPAHVAVNATAAMLKGDACNGQDYGTAGQFDFYVYAQSWPAQFCASKSSWPGCSDPTAWQQTNLTMHGMWPNYNKKQSGHEWPQCCQSTFGSDIDQAVVNNLLGDLQLLWPNEQDPTGKPCTLDNNCLWAHEWAKHGTCSGMPQKAYLQQAMDIEIGMPTPKAITDNVGGSVALTDLQAAYNIQDCEDGGDCMVGFNCQKSSGQLFLSGVTTCWDPNFTQVVCPAAVLSSQKQCTDDTVYILSF